MVVQRCQVDCRRTQHAAERISASDPMPRLWNNLPVATKQQLAQQMAHLIQRLRPTPNRAEGHDVEQLTGG
jgi:hypothetical protein